MLLKVQNLEVCYGVISALQDVSLQIDRGEIVALIGANGAGKTTLLRTISGLIRPQRGAILWDENSSAKRTAEAVDQQVSASPPPKLNLIDYANLPPGIAGSGIDITRLPPHEIVRLGISQVPEGRQIFANLTVIENLTLGGYQLRDQKEINSGIDRCFSLFPVLAERRQQRAGTLSGGEQQMLAIGRALMARPQLLLLDEPSLGLAPLIVRKIFQIIRDINAEGTTIFLVEQNAHMALTVAHRGYVLQTGQVIKTDKARSLLNDPEVKQAYLGG